MIAYSEWQDILNLANIGLSVPKISQRTRRSTTTIYRLLRNGGLPKRLPQQHQISKILDSHRNYLNEEIKKGVINAQKLFTELQNWGYVGSYYRVNQYVKSYTSSKATNIRPVHRFETLPGEQAQVDWGSCGTIEIEGKEKRLYCFVYLLGFSRIVYVEFTTKQTLESLLESHIHAFEQLGIPKTIVYDNPKTVVLRRDKSGDLSEKIHYNPNFLDFSKHFAFNITLCHPYWPRSKGKVESGIKYIKHNFLLGRKFISLEDANKQVKAWLKNVAHVREHGTTKEKPIDRLQVEKNYLNSLSNFLPYAIRPYEVRNSTNSGIVQFKSNLYPVPQEYSRKKLLIKEIYVNGQELIEIFFEDRPIVRYKLCSEKGKLVEKGQFLTENNDIHNKTSNHLKAKKSTMSRKEKYWETSTIPLSYYDGIIRKM